ncbi:GNAT family N-acetyltransferase [Acidithiobacillus sp. VAN18-1]|uniref:GNAT family N-acetyltransferase n=1 Tax=Igneacidithiobacillus copahuensis TaxID=2724909 RepID=A0AAE2YPK1_9PROT|nr:GNAT family N-acetyltransferase [Igneacidithiobacillus copahuensis]MBU2787885.1 GNAT family N-acetyltransferase [Igneacidithiobacillus copahuensis]MBU2795501.1 GNAT family N-acetyltransferase [Acidithiobacillus sp. VAN18-2]
MLTIRMLTTEELSIVLPLVGILNPNVPPANLAQRLHEMENQGYQCAAAFIRDACVGVAGIWVGTRLWCGRYVDVDNVIVAEGYRDQGIGGQLLHWVEEHARQLGCEVAVLDSYVSNKQSHKFYFRKGYHIVGFHFVKNFE